MNLKHKTKEGVTMLIAEMEDVHLIATINIFCNNINTFREVLDNPKELKKSEKVLYGSDTMSEGEAGGKLLSLTDKLTSYVFEAAIRGLDISSMLQIAYGRKVAVDVSPKLNF